VLIEKGLAGVLPAGATEHTPLAKHAERAATRATEELERCAPDRALSAVFELVEATNLYISRTEPWRTLRALNEAAPGAERKRLRAELELLLGEVGRGLLWIGGLLQPFLPDSAQQIGTALGAALPNPYQQSAGTIWCQLGAGARVTRTEVLCARLPLDAD
jgi:methionyl-tRNA synthetase